MSILDWLLSLIRVQDILEIGLVTLMLYKLYSVMRGTIAVQIMLGIGALLVVLVVVNAADMTILSFFLGSITDVFVLALIILFQPELRRLLLLLGQNPIVRRMLTARESTEDRIVRAVTEAVLSLSEHRTGALIVFERENGLRSYAETGTLLQATLDRDLIQTIFYGKNPLHDGAVIIQGNLLMAARCILPVTGRTDIDPNLGLRHRAALGLSEVSDALVVVVSEETGAISLAYEGRLYRPIKRDELYSKLRHLLRAEAALPEIKEAKPHVA